MCFVAVSTQLPKCHPHTIFINFNPEIVKNLFEERVTLRQIYGRTLMKAFTVAASYARTQFGVYFCGKFTNALFD